MNNRLGLFSLQGHSYALALSRLLRVIEAGCVYPLPLVPSGVAGMLLQEHELVPLLGSGWLIASAPAVPAARYQVVIASEYGAMALPADTTLGIVAESRGNWQPAAESGPGFLSDRFCYQGVSYRVVNIDALAVSLIRS
jgi:chemotaxis signal transduction protein